MAESPSFRTLVLGVWVACGFGSTACAAEGNRVNHFSNHNLIVNGGFEEGSLLPEGWVPREYSKFFLEKQGGLHQRPYLVIRDATAGADIRQPGLLLIPGETYKLSGYLKTKGFVGRDGKLANGSVVLIDSGWNWSIAIQPRSADSDWTYYERVFQAPASAGNFTVVLHTASSKGEFAVSDVRLVARQASLSAFGLTEFYNIIPLQPNPRAIPADKPRLVLSYPYLPPADQPHYECQVTLHPEGRQAMASRSYAIQNGLIDVDLQAFPVGVGELDAVIAEKGTGRIACKRRLPIQIVPARRLDLSKVRPLNNLVSQLQKVDVAIKPSAIASCSFTNPRDGWVWIAVASQAGADAVRVTISGEPIQVVAHPAAGKTPTLEAMRWLKAGEYALALTASRDTAAEVLVRAVPVLVFDAPNYHSLTDPTGKYDWAFMEKHVLPQCNVLLRGTLSAEEQAKAKARGIRWIDNKGALGINEGPLFSERVQWTPAQVVDFLASQPGFRDARFDGCAIDEFGFFGSLPGAYAIYARAFEQLYERIPANKLLYPYVCGGVPSSRQFYSDFLATVFHRGDIAMFEAYGETRATEAEAEDYLDDFFVTSMKCFKACFPEAQRHMAYTIGIFANMLDIAEFYHPEVDSKYYLDMQMHLVANHPEFQGLAGINTWTCGHADEETVRWMERLVRHYCIEGRREMLSKQYGFAYLPGNVANGDFVDGTTPWTCTPAEKGTLRADFLKGYGAKEGRWGRCAKGIGDTFLRMKRSAKQENKVSQEVKNLVPGKLYSLQVIVADVADMQGKKDAPGSKKPVTVQHALRVQLDQVEVIPERTYVYLGKAGKACRANLHRIVFRARTHATMLTLSDWASEKEMGGPAGQELAVNFVQLKPYFE